MTVAVAYLRTSSMTNADRDSPHRQDAAICAYADRVGVSVQAAFFDPGVSGEDPIQTRPGFNALIDHCEGEGIRLVIVEDQSRFARALMTQELGLALLRERGIRVVTSTGLDLTDNDDDMAQFVREILGAAHGLDKRRIVARLRQARERLRAAKGKCEGRKSHAELNPALVREAKRLARKSPKTGRTRSLRAIAAELAALGYLSSKGTPLSPQIVANLIA